LGLGNASINRGMWWVISPYERTDIIGFGQQNGFNLLDSTISQRINGFDRQELRRLGPLRQQQPDAHNGP
jgi:hypothetical protein